MDKSLSLRYITRDPSKCDKTVVICSIAQFPWINRRIVLLQFSFCLLYMAYVVCFRATLLLARYDRALFES